MSASLNKKSKVKDKASVEEKQTISKGKLAIRKLTSANKMKKDASRSGFRDPVLEIDAKRLECEAMELLKVEGIQSLAGSEAVENENENLSLFRETLKDPDSVSVGASVERMKLLDDWGSLQMATDASETIKAKNSLEKMLAHQMTACHVMSMKLMGKAIKFIQNYTQDCRHPDMDKTVKLVNASARLMDTFQRGLATLAKMRRGAGKRSRLSMFMLTREVRLLLVMSKGEGVPEGGMKIKNEDEPQGRHLKKHRFGWSKYGNPPCDIGSLPRCQAKAKSTGKRCGNVAMKGKRVCWIHRGKSTGPRSTEGLERSRKATWKHGYYSAEAIVERRYISKLLRETKAFMKR